jgi:hypothetical protein
MSKKEFLLIFREPCRWIFRKSDVLLITFFATKYQDFSASVFSTPFLNLCTIFKQNLINELLSIGLWAKNKWDLAKAIS